MVTDTFQEVKDRLTMLEVVKGYGFEPNRAGFIRCPFHQGDHTASLKLYPDGRGWHCFGCNRGGSVIDFVQGLFGVDALGAVQRLNDDFQLGLHLDHQQTEQERREAERETQRRREINSVYKAFELWRGTMLDKLTACFRLGHVTMKDHRNLDRLTDQEALAVREQAHIEYLTELLMDDIEAQMGVFRERREVDTLCGKILHHMSMKSGADS